MVTGWALHRDRDRPLEQRSASSLAIIDPEHPDSGLADADQLAALLTWFVWSPDGAHRLHSLGHHR
jgi:hypothetical protein